MRSISCESIDFFPCSTVKGYCDRKQLKLAAISQMGTASSPRLLPFGLTGKAKPLLWHKSEVTVHTRCTPSPESGATRGKLVEFARQGAEGNISDQAQPL